MKAKWQAEKEQIGKIRQLKERLDSLKVEAERAQRAADLTRAAELQYGEIPKTEREQAAAEAKLAELQKDTKFLKEEVDAEDIAEVVSKWTGIPVTRMLESERERLTRLEDVLA